MKQDVNNLEQIKSLLEFKDDKDTFYFVQIIQRKKDNKHLPSKKFYKQRNVITHRCINSLESLEEMLETELIPIAKSINARIVININPRSYKSTYHTLNTKINECLKHDNYRKIKDTYRSACSSTKMDGKIKYWFIDVDTEEDINRMDEIKAYINTKQSRTPNDNIVTTIKTKSGYHIITRKFDTRGFKEKFPDADIKRDDLLNLYIPNN